MKAIITYHRVTLVEELNQILALQKENLPQGLSPSEKQKEGFVTVQHSFDILKQMNDKCPHIIAKHNGDVIGYALCMHPNFANDIAVLKPMFQEINSVHKKENYIVMGQVCISKAHRKQGVFRGLYTTMRETLKHSFASIITEVDAKNVRSLNAHEAIGFKVIKNYTANNQFWKIISLEI